MNGYNKLFNKVKIKQTISLSNQLHIQKQQNLFGYETGSI